MNLNLLGMATWQIVMLVVLGVLVTTIKIQAALIIEQLIFVLCIKLDPWLMHISSILLIFIIIFLEHTKFRSNLFYNTSFYLI